MLAPAAATGAVAGVVVSGLVGAGAVAGAGGAVVVTSGLAVVEASVAAGFSSVFVFFLRENSDLKAFLSLGTASGAIGGTMLAPSMEVVCVC